MKPFSLNNLMPPSLRQGSRQLERVAYWFCRLNGCATIENFVVHPDESGSQRTDVDILAVRFPHRCELYTSLHPMQDHTAFTELPDRVQAIFVEVKGGNRACSLNGPWTSPERENMQRVLYALGAIPRERVPDAAARLYQDRLFDDGNVAVRLFAMGARKSNDHRVQAPVVQLVWDDVLRFIHDRLRIYERVKRHHPQWDAIGKNLYRDANNRCGGDVERFIHEWKDKLGVPPTDQSSSVPA